MFKFPLTTIASHYCYILRLVTFSKLSGCMFQTVEEVRIKAGQGIAGHVAQSGVLVNIRDAYTHPLFYRDVDKHTGFRTRYIVTYRDVLG